MMSHCIGRYVAPFGCLEQSGTLLDVSSPLAFEWDVDGFFAAFDDQAKANIIFATLNLKVGPLLVGLGPPPTGVGFKCHV